MLPIAAPRERRKSSENQRQRRPKAENMAAVEFIQTEMRRRVGAVSTVPIGRLFAVKIFKAKGFLSRTAP
jgi:hypothetical protein